MRRPRPSVPSRPPPPLVPLRGIDQIFTAVGEEVFLARRIQHHLPGVDVEAVLALLREGDVEGDRVVGDAVRHELREALLLDAVLVQRGHEVRQLSGHPELDLELAAGEHQRVLERGSHESGRVVRGWESGLDFRDLL